MTTTSFEPVIAVRGLRKRYGERTVLDGIDFTVGRGEIFALLGPNGAGKTTTVHILTTLLPADSGEIRIAGLDVAREAAQVRQRIGLTGQYAAVDTFQTGEENLRMMARLAHLDRGRTRDRVQTLLRQFDLVDAAKRPVEGWSGGMRRRLDLAMSLLAEPQIVFLDEPTTGLDPRSRNDLWQVVRALADAGTTIFLTTQYLEEADRLADTVAVIDGGRIVAHGTPADLKRRVGSERVDLVFATAEQLGRAVTLFDPAISDVSTETLTISLRSDQPARTLSEALARLDAAGLAVADVGIVKPTLDDVFLSLTGHAGVTHQEMAA